MEYNNTTSEEIMNEPSPSKEESMTIKKCIRKGDNVCYADLETITMLRKIPDQQEKIGTYKEYEEEDVDKIRSGESLYKSFSFEQSQNDEDTDKCVAFWKSVMEKNLEPIKCTIIENIKKEKKSKTTKDEQATECSECREQSEVEMLKSPIPESLWLKAFKEMQKKKLQQIELIHKSHPKFCTEPSEVDLNRDEKNSTELKKEMEELNSWTPPVKYEEEIASVRPVCPSQKLANVLDINEIMELKKSSGKYSEWRSNKLITKCSCGGDNCTCNTNPAIVEIKQRSIYPHLSRLLREEEGTADLSISELSQNYYEAISVSSSKDNATDSDQILEDILQATLNIIKSTVVENCKCGHIDCECSKEFSSRETSKKDRCCGCNYEFCKCNQLDKLYENFDKFEIEQFITENKDEEEHKEESMVKYREEGVQCEEEPVIVAVEEVKEKKYCVICNNFDCINCQGDD